MKRLLCILSNMNAGGAETFLMKIYRHLDRSKYQMDFCINVKEPCFYKEEIEALGGKIYFIPAKTKNFREYKKRLIDIITNNGYRYILRITSSAAGFLDLKIAKKAGAEICAVRSSNSSEGGNLRTRIAHILGFALYKRYLDVKIAPSDLAAIHTFGVSAYNNGDVYILHNAIDLDLFKFDELNRRKIREEFGISENVKVIGHIGRFDIQKNHLFLLDVFKCIHEQNKNAVLMLVGNGDLMENIRDRTVSMGLNGSVILTGVRSDIPQLLSAMDAMVFPSLYEGMPNAVIEAQAMGLPCLISDAITREANITGLVKYMSLSENQKKWADAAIAMVSAGARKDTHDDFIDHGYDINNAVKRFSALVFGEREEIKNESGNV